MSSRLSILAGLLVGIAVAALVLGGIVAFAPDPLPAASPASSLVRHGALAGIGPDEMVKGLRSIMPGVDVKP